MKKENNQTWKPILFGSLSAVALAIVGLDLTAWKWWVCMIILLIAHEITR